MSEEKQETPLVKMEKLPSVNLVVTSNTGEVLDHFHMGVNPGLAKWLAQASQFDGEDEHPVTKNKSMLTALGQDSYEVTRNISAMLTILAYPTRSLQDIAAFGKNMPETALYTFIVAY